MKTIVLLFVLTFTTNYEKALSQSSSLVPVDNKEMKASDGMYFGLKEPGLTPELFSPQIPFFKTHTVGGVIYSPDGKSLYLLVGDSLYYMKFLDGHWTNPEIPAFLRDYPKSGGFSISPDDNYFLFANKGDIFSCKRDRDSWSLPVKLPDQISSEKFECIASMSVDHSVYYASHRDGTKGQCDIFYSKFKNGQYETPVNMENFNTSGSECGVYVSPENDFIIFTGFENREGSYGVTDLYVSFSKDGSWGTPQNMGSKINTSGAEWPLSVSSDGKYFFFTRYTPSTKKVDIYWVDSRIIFQFKDKI